jgi:hypothetical protein
MGLLGGTVITADPPARDDLYQAEEIDFDHFAKPDSQFSSELVPIAYITPAMHTEVIGDSDLATGETLLTPSKKTTVNVGFGSLTIKSGSVVWIDRQAACVKVRVLFENASNAVQLNLGPGSSISLQAGQEAVLGQDKSAVARAMQTDRLPRRQTRHIQAANASLSTSEFPLLSFMQSAMILRAVLGSENKADRLLSTKLIKTAACLIQVTSSHGAYFVGK